MSDIDTVVVDSLKALDPEWPIRAADIVDEFWHFWFVPTSDFILIASWRVFGSLPVMRAHGHHLDPDSAVSLPPRLRMRPSTITVSTFAGCAAVTSMCAGSLNTPRLTSRVDTMIRSARLPGFSEPTLSVDPHRARALDGAEFEHAAGGELELVVRAGRSRCSGCRFMMPNMSASPMSADGVHRQPDRNARREEFAVRRQAEADAQLAWSAKADRGAGILDHRDLFGRDPRPRG